MKKVLVESSKTYSKGFNLTEPELRRIVELANEQLEKISTGVIVTKYSVKYENGVEEETKNLDEILTLENSGSTKIIKLDIELKKSEPKDSQGSNSETHKILIQFTNIATKADFFYTPIRLYVSGETRDWVFVTTSILEERIQKISIFSVHKLGERSNSRLLSLSFMLVILASMFLSMIFGTNFNTTKSIHDLDSLRVVYKQKDTVNIVDLIIDINKQQLLSDPPDRLLKSVFAPTFKVTIGCFIALILGYLGFLLMRKLYPPFNFNWGDYIEIFNRKKTQRNIVFIVIIAGIIVSVIGGLIANSLK